MEVPTTAGLVDKAVNQGPWLQERVGGGHKGWMAARGGSRRRRGWMAVLKVLERRPLGPPLGPRLGLGGGPRASVPGG